MYKSSMFFLLEVIRLTLHVVVWYPHFIPLLYYDHNAAYFIDAHAHVCPLSKAFTNISNTSTSIQRKVSKGAFISFLREEGKIFEMNRLLEKFATMNSAIWHQQ